MRSNRVDYVLVLLLLALSSAPCLSLSKRGDTHIVGDYTGLVAVHIDSTEHLSTAEAVAKATATAERLGYTYAGFAVGEHLPHYHLFLDDGEHASGDDERRATTVHPIHDRLERSDNVVWYASQMRRDRFKRREIEISDPIYAHQWHLGVLNVMPAWESGYNGTGVEICVVDDGLDWRHPDFAGQYDPQGSYDVNYNDPDPSPARSDSHGTSSTGTAAAGINNGACGVGVAFGATVSHVRMLARGTTDSDEAQALSYRCEDVNDVYSNSWGPRDDGQRMEGPGRLLRDAFEHCAENGRGGLGSVYAWACGNGKSSGDNVNYDGYANMRYTIPFGSITSQGTSPWYSEPGAAVFAVTPSSGSTGISTTDIQGSFGSSRGDCTDSFGGTSASSPMGAGVLALMLGANPNLSWRDAQHIVVHSCKRVDQRHYDWFQTSAGLWVNHQYGFGLLDANLAVQNALQWNPVSQEINATVQFDQFSFGKSGTTVSIDMNDTIKMESVELSIEAYTPGGRGNVVIDLTSPQGTLSRMQARHSDASTSISWRYMSVRNWDEPSNGTWQLTMSTTSDANQQVTAASITVYGTQMV